MQKTKNVNKFCLAIILFILSIAFVTAGILFGNTTKAQADSGYLPQRVDWIYAEENATVEYTEQKGWKVSAVAEGEYSFSINGQFVSYAKANGYETITLSILEKFDDAVFDGNEKDCGITVDGAQQILTDGKVRLSIKDKIGSFLVKVDYADSKSANVGAIYLNLYENKILPEKTTWVKSSDSEITYTDTYGWRIKSDANKNITINKDMVAYYISKGATSMSIQMGAGGDYTTISGVATPLHLYCYADAPAKGTGAKISVGANYIYNFTDETITVDLTDEQFDFINYEMKLQFAGIVHGQCDSAYIQSIKLMNENTVISEVVEPEKEIYSGFEEVHYDTFDGPVFVTDPGYRLNDYASGCTVTYYENQGWYVLGNEGANKVFYLNRDLFKKYINLGYESIQVLFDTTPFTDIERVSEGNVVNCRLYMETINAQGGANQPVNGSFISGTPFDSKFACWGPTIDLTNGCQYESYGMRFLVGATDVSGVAAREHFIYFVVITGTNKPTVVLRECNYTPNSANGEMTFTNTKLSVNKDYKEGIEKQFGKVVYGAMVIPSETVVSEYTHKYFNDNTVEFLDVVYAESNLKNGQYEFAKYAFAGEDVDNGDTFKVVPYAKYNLFGIEKYVYGDVIDYTYSHTLTEHAAVDPDCLQDGNTLYYSCPCGKYFSDALGETEIEEDSWISGALGHNYGDGVITAPTTEAEGYTTYTCTKCGHSYTSDVTPMLKADEEICNIKYTNLSLEGLIGVNFYVEKVTVDEFFMIVVTSNGEEKLAPVQNGSYWQFTVAVPVQDFNKDITFFFATDDNESDEYTYSIAEYANALKETPKFEEVKEVISTMTDYADMAAAYFSGESTTVPEEVSSVNVEVFNAYEKSFTNVPENAVKIAGMSLILGQETTIRLFFEVENGTDVESLTLKADGETVTAKQRNINGKAYYYIDKTNVSAKDLGTAFDFVVGDCSASCSAFSYAKMAADNGMGDKLLNMLKAMYLYYGACDTYFAD